MAIVYHGLVALSFRYNSEEIGGCIATAGCNSVQQFITNYEALGSVDGRYNGMPQVQYYPEDGNNEQVNHVDIASLYLRLCAAGYIDGKVDIAVSKFCTKTIEVPAGAPEGLKRRIEDGTSIFTMIDVDEDADEHGVDRRSTKFDFQTNRDIEGYNTFFFLSTTLTPLGADPGVTHQQHVYSVRRTTLTKLLKDEGEFDGYLIDGGEKGAKCHFILENEFKYFMFEEAGRACLNAHLSNVFKD